MGNEINLLDVFNLNKAFIESVGYEVEGIGSHEYKVTKRAKPEPVKRTANTNEYTEEFNEAWKPYPKRLGNNSKIEAYRAWNSRLKDAKQLTDESQLMISGVNRYAAYINAVGNENTEFVLMAATFFGPNKHYIQDWPLPKVRHDALRLPKSDDDLNQFALDNGLKEAKPAEMYPEFRKRLSVEVTKINKASK